MSTAIVVSVIVSLFYVKALQRSAFLIVPPAWQGRTHRTKIELLSFDLAAAASIAFVCINQMKR